MDLSKLSRDLDPWPYTGLLPYGPAPAGRLDSRTSEASAIASLWAENGLTLVHGSAGVGKTSLLQAGVIPHLQMRSFDVLPVGCVTSSSVFPTPSVFGRNPYTLALLSAWAPGEARARLSGMTITDFVKRERLTQSPVMLAIDKFEDIYRGPPGRRQYRDLLVEDLAEALARYKELRVLIVIRDDTLADFEASGRIIPDATFRVAGLHRDAAIQAVIEPLRGTGRILTQDAAAVLADEFLTVRSSGDNLVATVKHESTVPPTYLQLACICLWHSVPQSLAVITSEHVREYLDTDLCLSSFICQVLIGILQRYDLTSGQLATWLTPFFLTSEGRPAGLTSVEDRRILQSLLRTLEDCHILSSEYRSEKHYFQLASSRLMKPMQMALDSIRHLPHSAVESAQVVDYLADAARGYNEGDLEVAERQAIATLRHAPAGGLADRARAETLLANIAFERGEMALSRHFYEQAAKLFEVAGDSAAVGNLLAAVGRLQMIGRDNAAAVATLQSAVSRLPADNTVKIELARAFANSGEPNAAVAVLESALTTSADIGRGDAHILRGEILSDLENAAGL